MWDLFSTLLEPVNLVLLLLCAFLLYKILFSSRPPPNRESEAVPVETVKGDLTVKQLLVYDGKDPKKPVLLAVCGRIYDVTRGKHFYGPGGPYDILAGRDATRALALMSTDPQHVKDVDDDTSDLGPGELSAAREWQQSFEFKYTYVGQLLKVQEASDEARPDEAKETDAGQEKGEAAGAGAHPVEARPDKAKETDAGQEKGEAAGVGAHPVEVDEKGADAGLVDAKAPDAEQVEVEAADEDEIEAQVTSGDQSFDGDQSLLADANMQPVDDVADPI